MSFCSKCGSELKNGTVYCGTCGKYIGERMDKVSPVITMDTYCSTCGQKMNGPFCSKCGQSSIHMSVRKGILNTDTIKSNLGQVTQNIKLPKKEQILNKETYQAKWEDLKKKYDWKKLLTHSLIFVFVVNLLGILLGAAIEGLLASGLKNQDLTAVQIRGVKEFLQLKGNVLGMLYGMALRLKISVKAAYIVGASSAFKIALPWIFLLFLLLFVGIGNAVSKMVTKEKRSIPVIVVDSIVNGVIVTIILCILLHKQNATDNVLLSEYTNYYSGADISISHSGIGIVSFFYVFVVTLLTQMILPGIEFVNEKIQNVYKLTKHIFNVLLVVALVGGLGLCIGLLKCDLNGNAILTLPLAIGAGVGAFASIITSGGFSLASVQLQGELTVVKLGVFQLKLQHNGSTGVSSPFAIMQILLFLLFFAFLVITAIKYWKEHEATIQRAIAEVAGISALLSLIVVFLCKLCSLGMSTENGIIAITGDTAVYLGNCVGFSFFVKRFLYFFVIFIGAYFLNTYCAKVTDKVVGFKATSITGLTIALSCVVILIRSCTFSANSFEKTVEDLNEMDYSEVRSVLNIGDEIEEYFDLFRDLFEVSEYGYY